MTRNEKLQLSSIKAQIEKGKTTAAILPYLAGLGVQIVDGFAWVGNAQIDLRFENLVPTIECFK